MADIHLSSTGSNTSPYDTWAKAATSWGTAAAALAAGDRLLVDSTFATTDSTAINITFATGSKILSGVPASVSGLSALAVGAQIRSSLTTAITLNGQGVYVFGCVLVPGTNNLLNILLGSNQSNMIFDACTIPVPSGVGGSTRIGSIVAANSAVLELRNCTLEPTTADGLYYLNGAVRLIGGGLGTSASSTVNLFFMSSGNRGTDLELVGFDFSNLSTSANLISSNTSAGNYRVRARDCKLPSGFSGAMGINQYGETAEWWNCASDNTTYRMQIYDGLTTLTDEATIIRSGGASDGTTPLSWKLIGLTGANLGVTKTPPIVSINTDIGSAKTITVEITHSMSALTDAKIWLEVEYLGSSGNGKSTPLSTRCSPITSPVAHSSSSVTWGGSQTVKQVMSATFTPQKAGPFNVRVCMAGASGDVVYIDPTVTVS